MIEKHWSETLVTLGACREAVEWSRNHDSLDDAWVACNRGDWMLWLAGRCAGKPGSDARRPLVLAACTCARLALKYVPEGETRPLRTIETAEAWAHGESGVTLANVRAAAYAAYAAAAECVPSIASTSSGCAAALAYHRSTTAAATAAATATATDTDTAATAAATATATDTDTATAVRNRTLKKCATIVRKHYPTAPVLP